MSDNFIDQFPELAHVIDVGGIRYYMLPGKPVQDIYKSRDEYLRTFGTDKDTEELLRKYLGYSLQSKKHLKFESPSDKKELINILKKRMSQLKTSEEFTSSILKNTIFQRTYLNIQKLIEDLEGSKFKSSNLGFKIPELSSKCTKAKKAIKQIPENRLFFILLEIAWYLLHPDDIPRDIQCNWAELIQSLDTLRLGEIVDQIKKLQSTQNTDESIKPTNYFLKAGLDFAKTPKFENALEMIQDYIKKIGNDDANNEMKDRLKILLNILQMKKYLDDSMPLNKNNLAIINSDMANKISNSLITNPMRGGAGIVVNRPLGQAMLPFFNYFKDVFDPIYSFLESIILARTIGEEKTRTATIPQLVTLLHICNNLKPQEVPSVGVNSYGIYRITNVGSDIIEFFKSMLSATEGYIDNKLLEEEEKNKFQEQLFKLPKVRLTSLMNTSDPLFKDSDIIPYTRFLILNSNFNLKDEDVETEKTRALKDFFKPEDLYIVCTKSKTVDGVDIDIPMNLYEIDYDTVNVSEPGLSGIIPVESVFSSIPPIAGAGEKDTLEKIVNIKTDIVYNEAELALSIFILFKQLMPK